VYERAEATLSKSIDFGSRICRINVALCVTPRPVAAPYGPQKNDGFIEVDGDDTGIGWIVGMHIHPRDKLALGFTHRSEIATTSRARPTSPSRPTSAPLLALGAPGQFVDTTGSARWPRRPSTPSRSPTASPTTSR
jgi:long-chain fatty acid transport protein